MFLGAKFIYTETTFVRNNCQNNFCAARKRTQIILKITREKEDKRLLDISLYALKKLPASSSRNRTSTPRSSHYSAALYGKSHDHVRAILLVTAVCAARIVSRGARFVMSPVSRLQCDFAVIIAGARQESNQHGLPAAICDAAAKEKRRR